LPEALRLVESAQETGTKGDLRRDGVGRCLNGLPLAELRAAVSLNLSLA
jgi:hypothetical protein